MTCHVFDQSQEMKELAALAYRDTTNENREFWKSEMAQAMREIQATYDEKLDTMRAELETYYNMKVSEASVALLTTGLQSSRNSSLLVHCRLVASHEVGVAVENYLKKNSLSFNKVTELCRMYIIL